MTGTARPAGLLACTLVIGCAALCAIVVLVYADMQRRQLTAVLEERADFVAAAVTQAAAQRSDPGHLVDVAAGLPGVRAAAVVEADSGRTVAVSAASSPAGAGEGRTLLRPLLPPAAPGSTDAQLRLVLEAPAGGVGSARALWTFAVSTLVAALALGVVAAGLLGRLVLRPLKRMGEVQQAALARYQERLQLAVEGSKDALFDYDPGPRRLFLSDMFRRWFGGAGGRGEHVEVDVDEVMSRVHPDHALRVFRALRRCADTGEAFDEEFQFAKPDGSYLWLQLRGRGVAEGERYRVSGFASDISRRKVAESLLQDSVERLGAVLDNIAEGIVTLNAAGELCTVNTAARQMFGAERDALIGRPLASLLEMDTAPDWSRLADRQPRSARVVRVDGGFPAEVAVSTMQIRSDERFIVVLRDVRERRMAEDKLRAAITESEAATRAKDEFLATMSHEIRTPMNGVLGMTQLLLDMDLNPQQRETAQLIKSSGESLLTIINDILDFSRAGSGRLKVDSIAFDLRVAVREVVELLGRRRSPVDLYVDYPLEAPSWLVGDPGRVRQVLMNLVGNALKFTQRGHVVVAVRVETEAEAGDARFVVTVSDTGPGISAADQRKLFQPFTQADASTTRRFGGTGLGLAISRRLVELMGGDIGLSSEPGAGSRFHFTLRAPLAPAGDGFVAPPSLTGRRVLLVDDEPTGRDVLGGCLRAAGVEVVTADSAAVALEVLERDRFDAALVDDQMPNMDGLLLCELIRIDATWQDMRLVLMCAADVRGVDESRAVDRCMVKPLMPEFLLAELAALLEGSAAADNSAAPRRRPAGADPVMVPIAARSAVRTAAPRPVPASSAGSPPRVLLAEDNPVNQKVAVRMLEKLGCRIDVAEDGAEAVEMWRHFDYAAIIMDCQMPVLDGLEAARTIRRQELASERARTPIIAMTANAMHQDRSECLAAGMDDYLAKPVRHEDLAQTLGRWMLHDVRRTAGSDVGGLA